MVLFIPVYLEVSLIRIRFSMSEGFRASDTESQAKSKSPWAERDNEPKEEVKALVTRTGWGEQVAPLAQNMPSLENNGQNPNLNGSNGQKPWRAGFGDVAPSAQNLPVDQSTVFTGQQGSSPWQRPEPQYNPNPNPNQSKPGAPWRAGYPDSTYKGPAGTDAGSPDANKWRSGYPDSTYKGPDVAQNPSPFTPPQPSSPWRSNLPDSTYRPVAEPPNPSPSPGGVADWRQLAEQQMQRDRQGGQPQQPGGFPPTARAGDAPGVPGNPGLNGVTDDQRKYIENSLFLRTSVTGYLGTGAITGATVGAAEWALDRRLLSTLGQPQNKFMTWWEKHSPALKSQEGFATRLAEAESAHAALVAERAMAQSALTDATRVLQSMQKGVQGAIAADTALHGISLPGSHLLDGANVLSKTELAGAKQAYADMAEKFAALAPEQQLLLRQNAFLGNTTKITNPTEVAKVIGTQAEVQAGTKLFVAGTEQASQLAEFAKLSKANTVAEGAIGSASGELKRARDLLQQSKDGGAGSLAGKTFDGAVKGLAIAGGTLAAGYALDKLGASVFGYKQPEVDGMDRFLMDGVAVPAILMSGLPSRYKFALAGTAFLGSRVADYFAGTGASTSMSTLLRPNTVDGVLITASAMAPVDMRTKALLIGGSYLAGRAYNGIARLTGLDGGHPMELRDNAVNAFTHDQLTRTESSFDKAVEKAKLLGKENEAALELQMRDWLAKQSVTAPIAHMRGTATLAAGLGQFRLEEGSRFDLTAHADKKDRILKGYDYDFGGEATTWLRMSAGSLVSAQNYVIQNKGKEVEGQKMDDAYLQQLKNEQAKVEKMLDKVYGKHDIAGIFKELKNQARVNSGDMQQALVRMKNQFDVLNSNDPRYVAKAARDLSLGYLAEASYMTDKNNGEEARIMYLAANQFIQTSKRLDPNAPDNKALEELALKVSQGIPGVQQSIQGAVDKQYDSSFANPFELKTPKYPDLLPPRR